MIFRSSCVLECLPTCREVPLYFIFLESLGLDVLILSIPLSLPRVFLHACYVVVSSEITRVSGLPRLSLMSAVSFSLFSFILLLSIKTRDSASQMMPGSFRTVVGMKSLWQFAQCLR